MSVEIDPLWWAPVAFFAALFVVLVLYIYSLERRRIEEQRREVVPGTSDRARALILDAISPTLLIVDAVKPGFSKLGGEPELPEGVLWPTGYEGARTFVGQVDLAELPSEDAPDWLPRRGRLYFFYDPDSNGCADLVTVLCSNARPEPPALPPLKPWAVFRERRIAFEARTSAPSLEWLDIDILALDRDFEDFEEDMRRLVTAPPDSEIQHRIGGYPNEIQSGCLRRECELIARGLGADAPRDTDVEEASMQWRLLLQVDSDEKLRMEWHDGGRLYVFIRESDARAGDFSKTVTILQSY